MSTGFETWERPSGQHQRPDGVVSAALDWIGTSPQPFFLYVHVLEPHAPYEPTRKDWSALRPPGYRGDPDPVAVLSKLRRDGRLPADELC